MRISRNGWKSMFFLLLALCFLIMVPSYQYFNNQYEELEQSYITELYQNNRYMNLIKKKDIRIKDLEKEVKELETQIPK